MTLTTLNDSADYSAADIARWVAAHGFEVSLGIRRRSLYIDSDEPDLCVIPATVEAAQEFLGY